MKTSFSYVSMQMRIEEERCYYFVRHCPLWLITTYTQADLSMMVFQFCRPIT
jgi:hypothetical protein